MSGLLELAERCEKADGPDRELDFAIHDALRVKAKKHHGPDYRARNAKAYTNTIDAAMTLLPTWALPHIRFDQDKMRPGCQIENGLGLPFKDFKATAATWALALCAAALRARAAQ